MGWWDRFSRGLLLIRQSWHVLSKDKRLLIFPFLSALSLVAVLISFAVPIIGSEKLQQFLSGQSYEAEAADLVLLFLFYFVNYLVITLFNAALISCAITSLRGGKPTIAKGVQAALTRLPQIVAWSLLSASVGVLLRAVESRVPIVMRLFTFFAGLLWAVATYFAVPVMVAEGAGPVTAVKRSVEIIRKTWGESLVSNLGINAVFSFGLFLTVLPAMIIGSTGNNHALLIYLAVAIVFWLLIALVASALMTITRSAIYCYATDGEAPSGFDQDSLANAFRRRRTLLGGQSQIGG